MAVFERWFTYLCIGLLYPLMYLKSSDPTADAVLQVLRWFIGICLVITAHVLYARLEPVENKLTISVIERNWELAKCAWRDRGLVGLNSKIKWYHERKMEQEHSFLMRVLIQWWDSRFRACSQRGCPNFTVFGKCYECTCGYNRHVVVVIK